MATTVLSDKKSTYGNPYANYTVQVTATASRTASSVKVTFKVIPRLNSSSSHLDGIVKLTGYIYANGAWSSGFTIKEASAWWSGTGNQTAVSKTITLTGLSADATSISSGTTKFKVTSSANDNCCALDSTNLGAFTIPAGPPEPLINGVAEVNSVLTNLSVPDTTFVNLLSQKSFNVSATTHGSSSVSSYQILNGTIGSTAATSPIILDLLEEEITTTTNGVPIVLKATDSNGNSAQITQTYSDYIDYHKPTINAKVQRAGQLTGNVKIVGNGTYFNGSVGSLAISPTIKYRYKELPSGSFTSWTSLTPTKSSGNWTIDSNLSGTFDPAKRYSIEFYIIDNIQTSLSNPIYTTYTTTINEGEPTWTEYPDRVDIKKLTVNKQQMFAPYVLYAAATKADGTSGNVTLSDSAANYTYMDILYTYSSSYDGCLSVRVYEPQGSTVLLNGIYDNGTYDYFCSSTLAINGTTMTRGNDIRWRIATGGGNSTRTAATNLKVYRVIGYK